ncbi:C2 and GRAM domain-containing protein [Zea mays]|uniref:C2 and GRAM domain-containing protein n=2 Tax=Zea mays TaxID=4577 RepID=A0A1D6MKZ9_MAIZE|nr:C2 and GRAM domain-containing protein [Zea mays]
METGPEQEASAEVDPLVEWWLLFRLRSRRSETSPRLQVFEREFTQDQVIMKAARASRIENQDAIDTAIIGMLADPKEAQHTNHRTKLHLRIFLNNSKGTGMVTEYLSKMEKEVGKKMTLRSPRTNTAFQELFSLPAEEFLISSFTCYLKRKLPTQGQVFLSPRTIGFYSSMFGRKTKCYFLWEDIEDIQGIPQSISSWSPSIIITLHKGRGMDAKHGVKSMDNGKLKFCLQSFASFSVANRTIMALWKARSLSTEFKVQLAEEQSQINTLQSEDNGVFVGIEDAKSLQMTEVFSSTISTNMASLMEVCLGGSLEMKFSKKLSPVGGEVTGTQQKSLMPNKKGWVIEEVMELQGVLLGDFFTLHIKYQVEDLAPKQRASNVQVSLGIEWSKTSRHQKRIEKNVLSSSSARLKEMFNLALRELSHAR